MKPSRNPFCPQIARPGKSTARALALGGMVLAAHTASAANFYWDADAVTALNQSGDGNWNTTGTNWTALPGDNTNIAWANGSGNTAFIGNAAGTGYSNASAPGAITLTEPITLLSLSMSSGQTGSYVINGTGANTLTLAGTGPSIGNNNGTATLTINAEVTGTGGLKKINSGRVIIGGAGTYTGVTAVTAGTLQMGKQISLYNNNTGSWTAANIVVNSNTTLAFSVGGTGEFTSNDIATLSGLGSNGVDGGDPLDDDGFKNGSAIGFDTTNAAGGVFIHSSVIANPNGGANNLRVTKLGTNTLTLTAANTYSGDTLLIGGTIGIGNTAALGTGQLTLNNAVGISADGADQVIANNIFMSSTGSSVLTVSGTHNLTLNGNISASGSRRIATTIPSGAMLTITGNVYFAENNTDVRTFTFGGATATGSPGTVLVNGVLANNAGLNTTASNLAVSGSGTVILAGPNTYTGTTTITNTNTVLQIGNGGTTGNISAGNVTVTTGALAFNRSDAITVANTISGTGLVRQIGSGTTTLSGPNTYSGSTAVNAGILQISNPTALGTTAGTTNIQSAGGGALALTGGIAVAENITISARNTGDHLINTSGDNSLTGTLTWGSGGTGYGVRSDAGKLTLGGPVSPLLGSKTLLLHGDGNIEFTGVIGDTASGILSITKEGLGTASLSNTNTYTGTTTINGGTLVLTSSSTLADTAALNINVATGGVLNLPNAGTDIVGSLIINGTTMPDNIYDSTNSGGAITGAGKIQVGAGIPVTPYENWITTNYPGIPLEDRDPLDDPDHDGVSNLIEFALNGDPTSATNVGAIARVIQDASAPAGKELTLVVAVRDGATFSSGANGVRTATVDGITYTVEGSLNLAFPASAISVTGPADDASLESGLPTLFNTPWEYHTFKLDASEGLTGKGFLRLKVTRP